MRNIVSTYMFLYHLILKLDTDFVKQFCLYYKYLLNQELPSVLEKKNYIVRNIFPFECVYFIYKKQKLRLVTIIYYAVYLIYLYKNNTNM